VRFAAGPRSASAANRTALLAALGLACGIAAAALIVQSEQISASEAALATVLALLVGWAYIGSGLVTWRHRPESRLGPVMVFIGFSWFATFLSSSENSALFTLGTALEDVYLAGFVYLVLSFPSGRVTTRLDKVLVWTAVFLCTVAELAWLVFADSSAGICDGCPDNALQIVRNDGLAEALLQGQRVAGLALCLFTVALFISRTRRASQAQRRWVTPVLWTGAAMFAALALSIGNDIVGGPLGSIPDCMRACVFASIPVSILAVMLQQRLAHGAVAEMVVDLGDRPAATDLRDALSKAIGDPDLQLAYWIPATQSYVGTDGQPLALPSDDGRRMTTVVERGGEPVAALVHDASLAEYSRLIDSVCAAAALTLENERLRAELLAQLSELQASRARLVRATESERHRLERDLHDGAQQRLISIAFTLGLAESKVLKDPAAAGVVLREARDGLSEAMAELRALSQGIRPAILVERGLAAALDDLSRRASLPVVVDARIDQDVSTQVQAAAYFVASEALANAAKHSHASQARVQARSHDGRLTVEVADDGIGGAVFTGGSGLRGLADRVEGLGGRLTMSSPVGRGTVLRAELPCG
jgi:signal transduction histidine kinase